MDVADEARRLSIPRSISRCWRCRTTRWSDRSGPGPAGRRRRRQVMVLHGEIEGLTQRHDSGVRRRAHRPSRAWWVEEWSYIALGHYHVQHEVAPHTWYSGSLEYVAPISGAS